MNRSVVASHAGLVIPLEHVAAHWQIRLGDALQPLPAVTNIVLRAGDYVIRAENRPVDSVEWEHDLLQFLAVDVPEVVAPLEAEDGTTFLTQGGQVVSVFPFLEGVAIRPQDEAARAGLPSVLARIHGRALLWPTRENRPSQPSFRDLAWEKNSWWDLSSIELTPVLAEALDRTRSWIASEPDLMTAAIHGDLNPGNVLMRGSAIVAIIDWSFARIDWPAFDLACAVGLFALENDGVLNSGLAQRVVDSYHDAGGPADTAAMKPLLRIFFLAVSLFSLSVTARGVGSNPEMVALMERALSHIDE